MPTGGGCNLHAPTPCLAAKDCRPTTLIGGKGLPPYHPHRRQRVTALLCPAARDFYAGRHPHADRRGLQPARADALLGGKGLPLYFYQVNEGSNYHKVFFIFPHKTMNRRFFSHSPNGTIKPRR